MGKIPPTRILSDDCVITVGEVKYNVHKNEWVDVIPIVSVVLYIAISDIQNSINDPKRMEQGFENLCSEIAHRLVAWNWTDLDDKPYPAPTKEIIKSISNEEVLWLLNAIMGETPGQRKNASMPSAPS